MWPVVLIEDWLVVCATAWVLAHVLVDFRFPACGCVQAVEEGIRYDFANFHDREAQVYIAVLSELAVNRTESGCKLLRVNSLQLFVLLRNLAGVVLRICSDLLVNRLKLIVKGSPDRND